MSKIHTAYKTLVEITGNAIASPRCTVDAIKFLPALIRGMDFSKSAGFALSSEKLTLPESNPLLDYFNRHQEGPGLWKWLHYFDIYHRHSSQVHRQEC